MDYGKEQDQCIYKIDWKDGSVVDVKYYTIDPISGYEELVYCKRYAYWVVFDEDQPKIVVEHTYDAYNQSLAIEVDRFNDRLILKFRGEVIQNLPLTGKNLVDMVDYVKGRRVYMYVDRNLRKNLVGVSLIPLLYHGEKLSILPNEIGVEAFHACNTYSLYIGDKKTASRVSIKDIAKMIAEAGEGNLNFYELDEFITICYYNGYEYTFQVGDLIQK